MLNTLNGLEVEVLHTNPKSKLFRNHFFVVEFEVFAAMTLKNAVFWDVASFESCKNRRFGGTCRLHLHGRKIREKRKTLAVG
jgi:hypothetical protein